MQLGRHARQRMEYNVRGTEHVPRAFFMEPDVLLDNMKGRVALWYSLPRGKTAI